MKKEDKMMIILGICLLVIIVFARTYQDQKITDVSTNAKVSDVSNEDEFNKAAGMTTYDEWMIMTTSEKEDVASDIIKIWENNGEDVVKSAKWFADNLDAFYGDETSSVNVAKAMSMIAVSGGAFKEDADRIEKATSSLSDRDEEIWQFCMKRWEYYDALEGGYSGDKYTEEVFKDAGKKFGITASESQQIWSKVDRAKLGAS